MPLLTICNYPGCTRPVERGEKYCSVHKTLGEQRTKAIQNQKRRKQEAKRIERNGNANQRGYNYRWQKLSKRFRAQHPYCEMCKANGIVKLAECVDHIIPHHLNPQLLYDEANLQSLCWSCHSKKTIKEDGGFGHPIRIRKQEENNKQPQTPTGIAPLLKKSS